jgi:uncharacterized protein YyaL (SSP411 family)
MQALHITRNCSSRSREGWLSMFLTPDAKPLMGGTYFPPRDKPGATGFLTVLNRVQEAWTAEPARWQSAGDSLADYVAESLRQRPMLQIAKLNQATVDAALKALMVQYDATYGGFGFDPANPQRAFPEPPNWCPGRLASAAATARKMLVFTLEHCRRGIRDHVGGGFHRYSTDRYWRPTSRRCFTTTASSFRSTPRRMN